MQKLIVVGLDVYFADSFLWFAERGISVTVLTQTSSPACFAKNAALYADMGFRVLRYTPEDFYSGNFRIEELGLDRETLILAGPNFEGDSSRLIVDLGDSTFYDLWLLQALAGYNQQHACGAMLVRFHNGDTGFGSQEMAELYALALRDVDLLLFDNDLLRDFVFANCPTLSGKKSRLSWLENPLKRHVRQGEGRGVDFICLGRFICGHRLHIPVLHFPLAEAGRYEGLAGPVRPLYDLSIGTSLAALASERAAFARDLRGTVFGLDHLGGAFNGGFEIFARNKDFFFSPAGQQCGLCGEPRELYYHACNCSSKIASYLMFGIIPVIPHSLSTVYSDLLNKGMAVQVKEPGDLVRLTKMPLAEIEEYRKNIYASTELFTFGSQAERLLEEFEKFQAETWEQTARPDSDSQDDGGGGQFDYLIRKRLGRSRKKGFELAEPWPGPADWAKVCFLPLPEKLPSLRPWLDKWWVRFLRRLCPIAVDAWLIADSGAFDAQYYFTQYPGLLKKRRNPIVGYVWKGAQEGRNPNAWFNTAKYAAEHPEAARSGLNPLVHYLYVQRRKEME